MNGPYGEIGTYIYMGRVEDMKEVNLWWMSMSWPTVAEMG